MRTTFSIQFLKHHPQKLACHLCSCSLFLLLSLPMILRLPLPLFHTQCKTRAALYNKVRNFFNCPPPFAVSNSRKHLLEQPLLQVKEYLEIHISVCLFAFLIIHLTEFYLLFHTSFFSNFNIGFFSTTFFLLYKKPHFTPLNTKMHNLLLSVLI